MNRKCKYFSAVSFGALQKSGDGAIQGRALVGAQGPEHCRDHAAASRSASRGVDSRLEAGQRRIERRPRERAALARRGP